MPLHRFLRPTVTVTLEDTIVAAARKMRDRRIGCVVAVRAGKPVGILTDRDVAIRVVAEGRDPRSLRVADIVTYDPVTISVEDGVDTATATMRTHGVRRVPIVDANGEVVGIVTADDLLTSLGESIAAIGEVIEGAADASDTR